MKHNETRKTGPSRRDVVAGIASAALVGFGSERTAHAQDRDQPKPETTETYEAVLAEIEGHIAAYAEQPTELSKRDIARELHKCGFLERSFPLITIETDHIETELDQIAEDENKPDASREAMRYALDSNDITLPRKRLVVAQIDFADTHTEAEAFYDTEYQTIFVDQQPEDRKRLRMSRSVYTGIMSSELSLRRNPVITEMEGQDREVILAAVAKVEAEFYKEYKLKKNGTLHDVPPELLLKHRNRARAAIARQRAEAALRYVRNTTALTHEAFHHFFETMYARDGYEGPTQEEALVLALQGIRDRHALNQASDYAPEFFQRRLLEQFATDINDDDSIKAFAKKMSEQFDFSHYPAHAEYTPNTQDLIGVYRLVNEFLARIYSGALGNTDESFEAQSREQTKGIPYVEINFSDRVKDRQFHTPNERELAFLRNMRWQGQSILNV